jgi:hypothetical protein
MTDLRKPRVSDEELADLRANLGIPLSVAEISRLQDDLADSREALRETADVLERTNWGGPWPEESEIRSAIEHARALSAGSAGQEGK